MGIYSITENGLMSFDDSETVAKARIELELTANDIDDIMVTALEGGIGYWAILNNVGEDWESKPKGLPSSQWATKLLLEEKTVYLEEREEDTIHGLTLQKLIEGFEKNYKERPWDNSIEDGDASTADCIVQYAIFGEVVYG